MSKQLRWGILGTGNIANQFADGVKGAARSVVTAVGSRSAETACAFASKHRIQQEHPSYEALLADDTVDAIYLSLPNSMHHAWTLRALAAGKHVLCEKPVSVTAAQAEEMYDAARRRGLLLMEAFMYRCHPLTHAWMGAIAKGEIGRIRLIRTSFCYRARKVEGNVRYSPELAGGALMDIGCYCVNLSRMVAGDEPIEVRVTGELHDCGVDEHAAGMMRFGNGVVASFVCGMNVQANNAAHISGDEGWIEVPVPWKPPVDGATYIVDGQTPPKQDGGGSKPQREERAVDAGRPLYGMEADAFAAAVFGEAALSVTREDSIGNMRVLDTMRRQLGLAF